MLKVIIEGGTMYYISTYDSSHRGNTSDRSFLGDFLGDFRCVNADEFLFLPSMEALQIFNCGKNICLTTNNIIKLYN